MEELNITVEEIKGKTGIKKEENNQKSVNVKEKK